MSEHHLFHMLVSLLSPAGNMFMQRILPFETHGYVRPFSMMTVM